MKNQETIKCPKCETEIDVQDVLTHQVEEQIKKEYDARLMAAQQQFDNQSEALQKEKANFEEKKKKDVELFQERLDTQLRQEKKRLEAKLKAKIEEEQADQVELLQKELNEKSEKLKDLNKSKAEIAKLKREKDELRESIEAETQKALNQKLLEEKEKIRKGEQDKNELVLNELQKELNEKSEQIKELNKSKSEIEKLKREKGELKESIEAEAQKALNQKLAEEKEKIRKGEKEKNELAMKELEKQLEDQKKLTEEMKRKQEQGSMQMQGEVQELAIEEWLREKFPLDTIDEVKKGVRGADCIQIVHTRTNQNCGSIYYESKRTKDFQPSWIEKFKNDIRDKGADIGVLVTDAMPAGMDRLGMKEGIWICSYEEFKGLSAVLRESIVKISNAIQSQENKGDKMTMLYDYLTSNEFRLQIEGIVEGFTQMAADLETEKRSIQGHWKKREKQIQKVLLNTNFMYSSIKGIAGNAIQAVKALELPESDIEE